MNPTYSIVIPTRNNIPFLSQCLEAIIATVPMDTEVIVVSNGNAVDMGITLGYVSGMSKGAPITIVGMHTATPQFAAACNAGMKLARGKYIILLNDDTIPANGWLPKMLEAINTAKQSAPEIKWGYLGPMSNNVMMMQAVRAEDVPFKDNPKAIQQVADIVASDERHPIFTPAGTVSGFCMMITRECYEATGELRNFGTNGYEDNDFCLRAQEAGYLGLVANKAFVFHVGHTSIARENRKINGTEDIIKFITTWRKPTKKTLCAMYRVKIDTREDFNLLVDSLSCMSKLADYTVLVDDRSSFAELDVTLFALGLKLTAYHKNSEEDGFNEVRDRNKALQMARATWADWIWSLDHDEYPDERCTPELLQRMMNPISPQIKNYIFYLSTFWRGTTHIRADGVWRRQTANVMFRNLPCYGDIHSVNDSPFHCRRVPTFLPPDTLQYCFAFQIKHYGYVNFEKCEKKQKFYQEVDTVKDIGLIGTPNYEHLTDERNLVLLRYSQPSTTLLFLVKDEIQDIAMRLWQYGHMFNDLVLVNTQDNAQIKALAETFDIPYSQYSCCPQSTTPNHMLCDFAKARNFAIEQCKTDWIAFMDPDEEFKFDSLQMLDKVLLEGADAMMCEIQNYNRDKKTGNLMIWPTFQPRIFRNDPRIRYAAEVHETLEKAFLTHPELVMQQSPLVIAHYGFLKTSTTERRMKNARYAQRLIEMLEKNPEDYRALYALGVHLNEEHRYDDGDPMIFKAMSISPKFWAARWECALRLAKRSLDVLLSTEYTARPQGKQWDVAKQLATDLIKWFPEANV